MTLTKAKRILNELAEKNGRDSLLFRLIDFYKMSERGTINWHIAKELTVGDVVDSVNSVTWTMEVIDGRIDLKELIKILESGKAYSVKIFVKESYDEYCEAHKDEKNDMIKDYRDFQTYLIKPY